MRKKTGIGLVEVLIAVPILLVLMWVGIEKFQHMRLAAKRAEVPNNVNGIKMAQIAHQAAWSRYIEVESWTPSSMISETPRPWVDGRAFDTLGWRPDSHTVRGRYKVTSKSTTDFLVQGECDVDGDDTNSSFTATRSIHARMNTGANVY